MVYPWIQTKPLKLHSSGLLAISRENLKAGGVEERHTNRPMSG